MPLYSFEGLTPSVHPTAFIAPTATLVGDVVVEEGASVWYGAVLRADYAPVVVRASIQDGGPAQSPGLTTEEVRGRRWPAAAWCTGRFSVRSASCEQDVVLDGAQVGEKALVAAGSVVANGRTSPRASGGGSSRGLKRVLAVRRPSSGSCEPARRRRAGPAPHRHRMGRRLTSSRKSASGGGRRRRRRA
jgi:hypothetical protein